MLGDGIPLVGVNLSNINLSKLSMPGINLAQANLSGADLLKSKFPGANIDGADFTDALLDRSQQRALCERASGKTAESLKCNSLSSGYVPASEGQNKFNP